MGIIINKLALKTRFFKAGLLLSASILATSNIFANNSQTVGKDPNLVAFYNDVFNINQNKRKPAKTTNKSTTYKANKKIPDNCISSLPDSDTDFALDLRRKREQQNLKSLFSDKTITKQTKHIKNEIDRIGDIDTEVFLDLIQTNDKIAYFNLNERKIRCKQVKVKKPIKPKIIKPTVLKQIAKKAEAKAVLAPIVKEEVVTSPTIFKEPDKIKKNSLASQSNRVINRKCTAESTNKSAGGNDMAALFAKAFGKKAAVTSPSKVTANLRIDTTNLGELELFSGKSGGMDKADTKVLLELLQEVLKDHVFVRFKKELEKSEKTRFCKLNELGIIAFYNSTNLSLDIEVNPELRKPQILSLLSKKKANVRSENIIKAEKISGFLNAFTTVGINSRDSETDFRMRLEGSLNINGAVLETTGDYRNEAFTHNRTTLTYDKPEELKRFALGNISTGNRNFQENLELNGFRISKEFFLDPDLQITPRANESLQLNSDSEVELYINNQLIRRFYLNAGVYSLQDIGLYNGANNIRIRIKDEFGKVTVKTSQQFYDSHLLKPGLSLYAISVGYLSNQQSYANAELEKRPILSGYYQKGISKDLTLSLDAQLSSNHYLFGAESISSIELGSVKNSIAISGGNNRKSGFATSFEFKPNKKHEQISLDTLRQDLLGLDTTSRGLLNNWSITGEYRSKDFSLLNGVNPDLGASAQANDTITFSNRVFNNNQLKANLQTNFNLNISDKWQGTLNLGVADYYDANESYYANLSATRRFDNGARLSLGTRYDTEDEFSMNLQFSMPLTRKKARKRVDFDVLADSRDNAYETKLNLKPTSTVGENSLAASLEHFENTNSKQQLLDVQYRNRNFETKFTARNRHNKSSKSNSQKFNLGFNTAIACVGGNCASSYPINDSFALVSGPSNQTKPIALSNNNLRFRYSDGNDTGLPDNYTALIAAKGKKAVVRLESYRTQNINIDEGTLPNGYDSEKTEFSMFPRYHQGFSIKAGGEPATVLDGILVDDANRALSFKGGQWIPDKNGKAVAFFSNKAGKFRILSIPAGKYKLELFDYPDMEPIQIQIPDSKGKTHNIGSLIIKTPN